MNAVGGPSAYLDLVFAVKHPGIDTLVIDLVTALHQVGFRTTSASQKLEEAQSELSVFVRHGHPRLNIGLEMTHPELGDWVGLLAIPAEDEGGGPAGTILFSLTFAEEAVLAYPKPVLTATAERVLIPLCQTLALSLPVLLIELQSQLGTGISAWDAMVQGRTPEGFLLYLSPSLAHLAPGPWEEKTQLSNAGWLYRIPQRWT